MKLSLCDRLRERAEHAGDTVGFGDAKLMLEAAAALAEQACDDDTLGTLIAIAPQPFAGQRLDRTLESAVPQNANLDKLLFAAADEIRRLAAALHAALAQQPQPKTCDRCKDAPATVHLCEACYDLT